MAETPRQDPFVLDLDETPLPDAPAPADAPPVPDGEEAAAEEALHRAARGGSWGLGAVALAAAGALVALAAGLAAAEFVAALFARAGLLGWVGAALLAIVLVALVVGALREVSALARIARVERIRSAAAAAHDGADRDGAGQALETLAALYAGRPEQAGAVEAVRLAVPDMTDAEEILALGERRLLARLDAEAEVAVTRAARTVAATTAVLPMAGVDIVVVAWANLRMVRRIAEVYGGRAGWLGSWRLAKAVAQHIVATGAISATDDLLGPVIGGGMLGKLSRRFGEAAVNAALTARVGAAALEVCRPFPFHHVAAPRAGALVMAALRPWRAKDAA